MDLYNLGRVSWWESQCFYHALAQLRREGVIICYPSAAYVCLGLHDDLEQEIDQEYCRERGLPIVRRETGGGVVYLDSDQLFFQVVLRKDNPLLPLRRERFYERFLQPAVSVYRRYGLPAKIKAPADIVADGRKCSGNAAGDIGPCVAYVGNLLLDFDFETMSRVLRSSGDAYRRFLHRAMRDNMTTLADWTTERVGHDELAAALIAGFEEQFGKLTLRKLDLELTSQALKIRGRLTSLDWLRMPGRRQAGRRVKIAEGVYLIEKSIGAKGSIRALVRDGVVDRIILPEENGRCPGTEKYIGCLWEENLLDDYGTS